MSDKIEKVWGKLPRSKQPKGIWQNIVDEALDIRETNRKREEDYAARKKQFLEGSQDDEG